MLLVEWKSGVDVTQHESFGVFVVWTKISVTDFAEFVVLKIKEVVPKSYK